jgi:hypothetical protein
MHASVPVIVASVLSLLGVGCVNSFNTVPMGKIRPPIGHPCMKPCATCSIAYLAAGATLKSPFGNVKLKMKSGICDLSLKCRTEGADQDLDQNACTKTECVDGTAQKHNLSTPQWSIEDGDQCTTHECNNGIDIHTPTVGVSCETGNPCAPTGTCLIGGSNWWCNSGPGETVCSDGMSTAGGV